MKTTDDPSSPSRHLNVFLLDRTNVKCSDMSIYWHQSTLSLSGKILLAKRSEDSREDPHYIGLILDTPSNLVPVNSI